MKVMLIGLLLCIGAQALAQQADTNKIRTRISDDGGTLSIQIDGDRNGQRIHFDQAFDVAGMNGLQKKILKYRVFAAVGVPLPFKDILWLIGLGFGFVILIMTFLIVRFQKRRSPLFPDLTDAIH
ncbi:hypothetical protein [Salmonirosea aquatica]|uniref:Uncharacterized protein n=1 Tax=Salmonirosea aquatica TaxID=2654236 RepID=A0A7C9BKE6_9BACT|nr:hypothetical protein [Cytophagaceae bacterium SJW1-29]